MTRYGPESSTLTVFTSREGALSAVGHDLALEARAFTLDVDEADGVTLVVDAASLAVRAARVGGEDQPRVLSSSDKAQIARAMADEVLRVKRFPEIRATAPIEVGTRGQATLTLCGVTREVPFVVDKTAENVRVTATVVQSLFGIRPYRALLGTLRVKDEVLVELVCPRG